jgi:uncharacterized protein (DUF608 family)
MERGKHEAKTYTSYNNSLHETRFKVLLLLYRMGGFTLRVNSASTLNKVYNAIVSVCVYITNFCMCVDAFVHRHQLTLAMKKIRTLLVIQLATFSHFSVR